MEYSKIYVNTVVTDALIPLLSTWINFNSSKDDLPRAQQMVQWNHLSILKIHSFHNWSLGVDK